MVPITTDPRTIDVVSVLPYPGTIFPDRAAAEEFLAVTADLRAPGEFGAVPFVDEKNTLCWLIGLLTQWPKSEYYSAVDRFGGNVKPAEEPGGTCSRKTFPPPSTTPTT